MLTDTLCSLTDLSSWHWSHPDKHKFCTSSFAVISYFVLVFVLQMEACMWTHTWIGICGNKCIFPWVGPSLMEICSMLCWRQTAGFRNTLGVTFYRSHRWRCCKECMCGSKYRGVSWGETRGTFEESPEASFTLWTCHGLGCGPQRWGSGDGLCNHTDGVRREEFEGHAHMSTAPKTTFHRNANHPFAGKCSWKVYHVGRTASCAL